MLVPSRWLCACHVKTQLLAACRVSSARVQCMGQWCCECTVIGVMSAMERLVTTEAFTHSFQAITCHWVGITHRPFDKTYCSTPSIIKHMVRGDVWESLSVELNCDGSRCNVGSVLVKTWYLWMLMGPGRIAGYIAIELMRSHLQPLKCVSRMNHIHSV